MTIETDTLKYTRLIPDRLPDSNKGTYGKVLVIAGSDGMSGAAYLSALAAYRSGAGLVKFLTHRSNQNILQTLLPEAVFEGYDSGSPLKDLLMRNVNWADIIVLGPGLGTTDLSVDIMETSLAEIHALWGGKALTKEPLLIVDADGLNILSAHHNLMKTLDQISQSIPVVITPHPMEMSRLTGAPIDDILSDPPKYAIEYSKSHNIITLLKGSQTIVSPPTGDELFKNPTKSPSLSKGGSGDVLSGAIAGLYSIIRASERNKQKNQSYPFLTVIQKENLSSNQTSLHFANAYISAIIGVIVHNEAGRLAAKSFGVHGVLARDTANCIGCVLDSHHL